MTFFGSLVRFVLAFAFVVANDNLPQLKALVGVDFFKEALDTQVPSVYENIKSSVASTQPFDQTVGVDNYHISDLSLTEFEYHPNDLSITVPSKENILSLELSKADNKAIIRY